MNTDLSDPRAFERAYDQHSASVYTAAYRILGNSPQAQDVVQDMLLRLWRRPRKLRPARGELGAYLRMVARSRALDVWREGQAAGRASDRLKVVVAGDGRGEGELPGAVVERKADRAGVREALERLPLPQREAIVLAYWAA